METPPVSPNIVATSRDLLSHPRGTGRSGHSKIGRARWRGKGGARRLRPAPSRAEEVRRSALSLFPIRYYKALCRGGPSGARIRARLLWARGPRVRNYRTGAGREPFADLGPCPRDDRRPAGHALNAPRPGARSIARAPRANRIRSRWLLALFAPGAPPRGPEPRLGACPPRPSTHRGDPAPRKAGGQASPQGSWIPFDDSSEACPESTARFQLFETAP